MNTLHKNVLIALAALTMGGAVAAAEQQAQAPQARQRTALTQEQRDAKMAERHAKQAEHRAQRLAKLHDALKLNASQEQAWNAFVASSKPAGRAGRPDRAAWAKLSAPARMEKMIERSKQRTAAMESRLPAINTFYATLTPQQKQVFDQQAMHGQHGDRHHGGDREHGKMQG